MDSLLILFHSGFGSFISVAYFKALSGKPNVDRYSIWKIYSGLFVALLFVFSIGNYGVRLLVVSILILVLSHFFRISNGSRLFFTGTFVAVCSLATVFSAIVLNFVSGLGISLITEYINIFSAGILYIIIYFFVEFIKNREIKANASSTLDSSLSILFLAPILLIMLIQFIISYNFDFRDEMGLVQALVLLIFLAIFLLNNVLMFMAMSYKTAFIVEKDVKDEAQRNLDLQRKHYRELLDQHRLSHKEVHDLKNKLQVVILAVKLSKNDFALGKLEELVGNTFSTEGSVDTGNKVVDAIFGSKRSKLNESEIELNLYASVSNEINMNDFDLAVIIGNAIDNAIEACLKLPVSERYVEVEIEEEDHQLIFVFTNPTSENLVVVDNIVQTSKSKDRHLHGFGLENMREIARKYDGYSTVNCEAGFFELKLNLQIPQE